MPERVQLPDGLKLALDSFSAAADRIPQNSWVLKRADLGEITADGFWEMLVELSSFAERNTNEETDRHAGQVVNQLIGLPPAFRKEIYMRYTVNGYLTRQDIAEVFPKS